MSKTKGGGSTRNGRDSNAQRLGVKVFDGTQITRRHDHRPPARHQVPPRQERRHRRRRHAVRPRRRQRQVRRAQGPQGRRRHPAASPPTDERSPPSVAVDVSGWSMVPVVCDRPVTCRGSWFRSRAARGATSATSPAGSATVAMARVRPCSRVRSRRVAQVVAWCRIGPPRGRGDRRRRRRGAAEGLSRLPGQVTPTGSFAGSQPSRATACRQAKRSVMPAT